MNQEIYRNEFGKERRAYPSKITRVESAKRRKYFKTKVRLEITQEFLKHGINEVTVDLTGSVETNEAGPNSDIDCIVSRVGAEVLTSKGYQRFLYVADLVERQVNKNSRYDIEFLTFPPD